MHWSHVLTRIGACDEAVYWAETQPDPETAWRECTRGDWMLWLLGRLSGPPDSPKRKKLVLAACACARLALRYVPPGETRPETAIRTTERWARDEGVSLAEVTDAGTAADASYAAGDDAATANAAAAAYAASTASAYATAATAANAATAAAYSAARGTRNEVLRRCANIVRMHYPTAPTVGE